MNNVVQKIPKGYKQTEVGVIPEDWEAVQLGRTAKVTMGQSPSSSFYNLKGIGLPLIQGNADIKNRKTIVRVFTSQITKKGNHGDAVMTVRAPVGEVALARFDCCLGRGVCGISYKNAYLYHYLVYLENYWSNLSKGSTFDSVNSKEVNELLISLPIKETEQITIANVLSDTDGLIEKLEQLIAKKKAIKQGAMQELLTGKRRLTGFDGEWGHKLLGNICENIKTGKLDANAMKPGGEYRFYTCAKEYYYIDKFAFDTEALLISGNGANVGYIHYYKGKFNAYQRTYILYDFSEDIAFVKLVLDSNLQERIRVEVNAGNTPYITMGTLTEMKLFTPPTKEEQSVIAHVLLDTDSEIEKLKKELFKYRQIKIGMMQQLLTGKIRLVN